MREKYRALRYSDDMWEDCKNGVWTVECNSWKEFEDTIEEYKEYAYLWRGQSCEKPLQPSIYRDHNIPDDKNIDQHLNQFKKDMTEADALEEFLESAKKNRTVEYENAFREYYGMINPKADDKDPKDNYEKEFIDDIYWSIGQMFGRIKAQEGLFTRTLYNEDIEKHIKKCYSVYKEHRNDEIVFLVKILIPNGVREDFLKKLEGKKITYKTMYPDLKGATLHCNLKFESAAM